MLPESNGIPLEEEFFTSDWVRIERWFPWLRLFHAFRIAVRGRVLALAAVATVLLTAGERVIGPLADGQHASHPWPWERGFLPSSSALSGHVDLARIAYEPLTALREAFSNGAVLLWPIQHLLERASILLHPSTTWGEAGRAAAALLWGLVVMGLFGGLVSRMAALELVHPGRGTVRASVAFCWRHALDFCVAPLIPLVGFGILWGANAALGLMGTVPVVGAPLLSVGWLLVLLIGVMLALIVAGMIAGWPLMIAAISTEGSDGFDGFSRAYCYLFNRPWYALFLGAVAVVYGSALLYFVVGILALSVRLAEQSSQLVAPAAHVAAGDAGMNASAKTSSSGANGPKPQPALLDFWRNAVRTVPAAFTFSYFWTAGTLTYLLLRRREDGMPLTRIHVDTGSGIGPDTHPLMGIPAATERERRHQAAQS